MQSKLKEAQDWFDKAVKMEQEGKSKSLVEKALAKAIELEKEAIANGARWE